MVAWLLRHSRMGGRQLMLKRIAGYIIPPPPKMPKRGPTLAWARRMVFWISGRLGDIQAVTSGNPERILKRAGNKVIGRNVTRKIQLRSNKSKRK